MLIYLTQNILKQNKTLKIKQIKKFFIVYLYIFGKDIFMALSKK
jgi:hypothetical protein